MESILNGENLGIGGGDMAIRLQDRAKRVGKAAAKLRGARAAPAGKKLAFLGFGKKKKVLGTAEAEAAKPPDKGKGKGFVGSARDKAKQARRDKLIAAGFSASEAAEMEP